jgi:hypothetical protein
VKKDTSYGSRANHTANNCFSLWIFSCVKQTAVTQFQITKNTYKTGAYHLTQNVPCCPSCLLMSIRWTSNLNSAHTKPSGNCKVVHKLSKAFYIPHLTDNGVNLLNLQACHYEASRPKQIRTAHFVGYIILFYN